MVESQRPGKSRGSLVWVVGCGLVLVLYMLAVYPALSIPFVLDDHSKIVLNPDIRSLQGLWAKLIYPYGPSAVSTRNDPSRPLIYLVYTLIYAGWGATPKPYHLVSLIFHAVNGLLVIFLVRSILLRLGQVNGAAFLALVAGGFFLLTPVNVTTAAYIYGLSDVMSLTFILLAISVHGMREKYPFASSWMVFFLTLLALSAKQIGVLIPIALMLLDGILEPWVFSGKPKQLIQRYTPSVLPVILYLVGRYMYFGRMGDLEGSSHVKPLTFYLLAQAHAILHYVSASFVPLGLCLDHDLPYPPQALWEHLAKNVLLAMLTVGSGFFLVRNRSDPKARLALCGLAFIFVWLAPTSSFIPTVDYVVERRIYGGVFGLALCLVAGLLAIKERFAAKTSRHLAIAVVLLVYGVGFAWFSFQRLSGMQDEKNLWLEILSRYPTSYRALGNLANAHVMEKNFIEAVRYYERIIALLPDHATTYTNIGFVYAAVDSPVRDLEKAKFYTRRALELNPANAEAWQNMGLMVLEQGHLAEAEAYFRKAIEVDPRHLGAYNQLCALMLDQKRLDEARVFLEISRSLLPTHPMVIENTSRMATFR